MRPARLFTRMYSTVQYCMLSKYCTARTGLDTVHNVSSSLKSGSYSTWTEHAALIKLIIIIITHQCSGPVITVPQGERKCNRAVDMNG